MDVDPDPREAAPFPVTDGHVDHPYLAPRAIEGRTYQIDLAVDALQRNTLVILPTGMGKTIIASLLIAELKRRGGRTMLVLAPTRPLAQQHHDSLQKHLADPGLVTLLSGGITPARRTKLYGGGRIIVATPQTIRNDLDKGRYTLQETDLIVFDEAHHAVGDYAYVQIAAHARMHNPRTRILGLTASPGASKKRLDEVRRNLHIRNLRSLTEHDPSVAPYVEETTVEWVPIALPASFRRLSRPLQSLFDDQIGTLRTLGLVKGNRDYGASKRELVSITQSLGMRARKGGGGAHVFGGLYAAQVAMHAQLALELLETQGIEPLRRHLARLMAKDKRKRAEAGFVNDKRTVELWELLERGVESSHPKMTTLRVLLKRLRAQKADATAIVFAQFRDTVDVLVDDLAAQGIPAERFVGQGSSRTKGMNQAMQREILDRFRAREFPVLVSTSVGEEGIDVPQVDLVVFYEAVPSEIRAIQRRGRTGRTSAGRVAVLVAKGTRDEAYLKAQTGKEARMRSLVSGT